MLGRPSCEPQLPTSPRSRCQELDAEGEAALVYEEGVVMPLSRGESVFIPANFGAFSIRSKDCTLLMTRTLPKEKA